MAWLHLPLNEELNLILHDCVAQIPEQLQTDQHGKKHNVLAKNFHVSFLLKIAPQKGKGLDSEKAITEAATTFFSTTKPVKISLGKPFVTRVDRIKSSEVWCVGIPVESDELLPLRQASQAVIGGSIPYNGPGHISVVYFEKKAGVDTDKLVTYLQEKIQSKSFVATQVVWQGKDRKSAFQTIPFGGSL